MLTVGTKAPEFELASSGSEKNFKLSHMRGKRIVIVFYPADWTPVCTSELSIFNEALDIFKNQNTGIVGVSVDSVWCHIAFSLDRSLDFPLLADFEPKRCRCKKSMMYMTISWVKVQEPYTLLMKTALLDGIISRQRY